MFQEISKYKFYNIFEADYDYIFEAYLRWTVKTQNVPSLKNAHFFQKNYANLLMQNGLLHWNYPN